jgi:hypothetical protein
MGANRRDKEQQPVSTGEEDLEELEDDDDLEEVGDDDEDAAASALAGDDDDDDDDSSLDELLSQRSPARRGTDDTDDDEDPLALVPDPEVKGSADPLPSKITPIKDHQEFVCKRCYLVKKKSQLADAKRMLCRDCV